MRHFVAEIYVILWSLNLSPDLLLPCVTFLLLMNDIAIRSRCEGKLHRTWSTTASWWRTLDAPASLRSRQRPRCSENKHSTRRQEFLGCGCPRIWNGLLASPRQPDIEFGHFKRLFLFGALVTFWFQWAVYKSIYLLTYLLNALSLEV